MMDYEYDIDGEPCPKCGSGNTRFRDCDVIVCEDGYIDEYDDDPINFAPGQEYTACNECRGYGILRWCADCGCDLND